MSRWLSPSDFTGYYKISLNKFETPELQEFIDMLEVEVLQELLGCELYDEFIADLDVDNNPQSAQFIAIFNEFCIDDTCISSTYYDEVLYPYSNTFYFKNVQRKSEGMVEMLKGFIFWAYVNEQKYKNTVTGQIVNDNETSREVMASEFQDFTAKRYNKAIDTYKNIQWYICDNDEDYTADFNGLRKDPIYFGGSI